MSPVPDLVLACPACTAAARLLQVGSADLSGAVTWTDGWQAIPGLERPPRITRCPGCKHYFWTGEGKLLGYVDLETGITSEEGVSWKETPRLATLDESELIAALDEGAAATPELELELRVAIWWRGNDAYRSGNDQPPGYPTSERAVQNVERLIEMMSDGDEDLLLFRAEAQRELGRFDAAKETLKGVGCSDYWPAKSRLLELIEESDRRLRVMFA
jgi:hypothetical protein